MTIAFVHDRKAFLPEISAYRHYFSALNINSVEVTRQQLGRTPHDVEWFFMGTDFNMPGKKILKIHEYASGSVPPARRCKDWIKRHFNTRPHFRLFLNAYVKNIFSFRDAVPCGLRDMGIWPGQFSDATGVPAKKYDFVYAGSVSEDTHMERLLNRFIKGAPLAGRSLLIVSRNYERLRNKYLSSPNIIFKGPVAQPAVADLIRQARFGINYKPDIAPYDGQTSTKLLEYAACGIPVITSRSAWIGNFEQQYGGNYFYLSPDLSNLDWEKVAGFSYAFPNLQTWTWEHQIRSSGVTEFLSERFPEIALSSL